MKRIFSAVVAAAFFLTQNATALQIDTDKNWVWCKTIYTAKECQANPDCRWHENKCQEQ